MGCWTGEGCWTREGGSLKEERVLGTQGSSAVASHVLQPSYLYYGHETAPLTLPQPGRPRWKAEEGRHLCFHSPFHSGN